LFRTLTGPIRSSRRKTTKTWTLWKAISRSWRKRFSISVLKLRHRRDLMRI